MYKILVVDDEDLMRQDLTYKVGGSGFPLRWLMSAGGAEEALEIIRENRPDILVTDIMMWEMDGLDLIEAAREIIPDLVSVIICGYPDFNFAQRALKLGVVDYLLKPVNQKQVSAVMAKAISRVEENRNAGALEVDNQRMERDLTYRKALSLLNGAEDEDLNSAIITGRLSDDCTCYQVLRFRLRFPEEWSSQEKSTLRYGAMNILEELGEGCLFAIPGVSSGEVVAVAGFPAPPEERTIRRQGEKMCASLEKNLKIWTDVGMSQIRQELGASAYMEARDALDFRFSEISVPRNGTKGFPLGGNPYLFLSEKKVEHSATVDFDLSVFRKHLNAGDLQKTVQTAQAMLGEFRGNPIPGIRNTYVELVSILFRACYRKGAAILSMLGQENISGAVLDRCDTLDELITSFTRLLETAMGQWMQNQGDTGNVLQKVKQYIEEHFTTSELCTKELAKEFCISLGYLSASYKKAFGVTISKHIIGKRVEYAEHLLVETDLSVQSISESSGFNNLSYFMRVFKAYRNCTPSQYRDKNKR